MRNANPNSTYFLAAHTTAYVRNLLVCHTQGRIHSVYRKTVNLQFGDRLIALQAENTPLSPLSLIVSVSADTLASLPIQSGQAVSVTEQAILLHLGQSVLSIAYTQADVIDTTLSDVSENFEAIHEKILHILERSQTKGFRRLYFPAEEQDLDEMLILSAARSYLQDCTEQAFHKEYLTCAQILCKLIGLGIGLTPSGDDFLCGMLAGIHLRGLSAHPFSIQLREQISKLLCSTNEISMQFLRCALEGEFSLAVLRLLSGCSEQEAAENFAAIGHSSGMDTLCGIHFCLTLPIE